MIGLHGDIELQSDACLTNRLTEQAAHRVLRVQANHGLAQFAKLAKRDVASLLKARSQHALGCNAHHTPIGQMLLRQRGMYRRAEQKTYIGFLQHQRGDDLR